MEKKNKVIAGLAIGAVALLAASGVARCSLSRDGQSALSPEQPAPIEQAQQAEQAGRGGLGEIENTTWVSDDGKSTLMVLPGVLIESSGDDETLLYYTATGVASDDAGITATLFVSKEPGGEAVQAPLAVTRGNGSMRLACDALSADYPTETGDASIALVSIDENLTGLFGRGPDDFAAAISKWASVKSPYARKATWTKEVWVDYTAGSKVTTFTLDDGAASTVNVTLSASGELAAS